MKRGECQAGGAAHRGAAENDPPRGKVLFQIANDLNEIGFGFRSHPGGLGAVVGRDENHAVFASDVTDGPAFGAILSHELPSVAAVAVEYDQNVDGFVRRESFGKDLDVLLAGPVAAGRERDVIGDGTFRCRKEVCRGGCREKENQEGKR